MSTDEITLTEMDYRLMAAGEYEGLTPEQVLDLKRRFLASGGVYPKEWERE